MAKTVSVLLLAATSLSLGAAAHADVPTEINFQGRIEVPRAEERANERGENRGEKDKSKLFPFTGTGLFKFDIVDDLGIVLWTNTPNSFTVPPPTDVSIPVKDGIFNVALGDPSLGMPTISTGVFQGPNRSLRIFFRTPKQTAFQELLPPQKLMTVPYAFVAATAQSLPTGATVQVSTLLASSATIDNLFVPIQIKIGDSIFGRVAGPNLGNTLVFGSGLPSNIFTSANTATPFSQTNGSFLDIEAAGGLFLNTVNTANVIMSTHPTSLVGIGTTAPTQKLEVFGNIKSDFGLIASTGVFSSTLTVQGGAFSVGGSTFVVSGGNVGIGTAIPTSALTVFNGDIRISTTSGSRGIIFQDGTIETTAGGANLLASTNAWSAQQTFLNQIMVSTDLVVTGALNRNQALLIGGPGFSVPNAKLAQGLTPLPSGLAANYAYAAQFSSAIFVSGASGSPTAIHFWDPFASPNNHIWEVGGSRDNDSFEIDAIDDGVTALGYGLVIQRSGNSVTNVGIAAKNPATTLDVNGTAQFGSGVAKSTFSAAGALTLASNAGLTLAGASGSVTTASSVTASAFFGDGSHLTNIPASAVAGGAAAGAQHRVVFTSNGTWAPPSGVATIWVSMVGGGGGGGESRTGSACGGGGGAGDALVRFKIFLSTAGTPYPALPSFNGTLAIAVGPGGAGGNAYGSEADAFGGNGGNTTISDGSGDGLTVPGGEGGPEGNLEGCNQGGASGGGAIGECNGFTGGSAGIGGGSGGGGGWGAIGIGAQFGGNGGASPYFAGGVTQGYEAGGGGGASAFGPGGASGVIGAFPGFAPAGGYGGGGGGGCAFASPAGPEVGGAGAPGLVVIEY